MKHNIDHISSISGIMTSFVQNGGAPKAHKLMAKIRHHLPRGRRVKA
jgi:hypothetical protein